MVMRLRKLLGSFSRSSPAKTGADNVIDAADVRITEVVNPGEPVESVESTKDLEAAKEQLRQLSSAMYSSDGKDEARLKEALAQLLKPESGLKVETVKIPPEVKDEVPAKDSPSVLGNKDSPPVPENKDAVLTSSPAELSPLAELTLQTTKASTEEVKDVLQVNSASAEAPLSPSQLPNEVKIQGVITATASGEEGKKGKIEGSSDMLSKIFIKEDEEDNPLAALMASLPDASLRELLDEAKEVEAMLGEWQKN